MMTLNNDMAHFLLLFTHTSLTFLSNKRKSKTSNTSYGQKFEILGQNANDKTPTPKTPMLSPTPNKKTVAFHTVIVYRILCH